MIDYDGTQVGVVSIEKAKSIATERNLDLLLVSSTTSPPVCRVIDFGQFRYQQQKKEKQSKKSGRNTSTIKELKMSPKISEHDYMVRLTSAKKFLTKGFKVKLTVFFRGREITHPELGKSILEKFLENIKDLGSPESKIMNTGKIFSVIINPK